MNWFITALLVLWLHGYALALDLGGKYAALESIMRNKLRDNALLLIDGDNVRGKTKFSLSKEDLCSRVESWMHKEDLKGRVILFFDHASRHCR